MKKRFTALMLAAVFTLSTTACAKDINEILEDTDEVTVETSVEAASEASTEEIEEKPDQPTEEASDEAVEEASAEASEETDETKPAETGDVTSDKRYENSEFNVALVIDDNMSFLGQDDLDELTAEESDDDELPEDVNPLVEALNYYHLKYVAHALSDTREKEIYVKTADLSEKMVYSESAFTAMSSVRLKVQLEDSFDSLDVTTEDMTLLGDTRTVIKITYSSQGLTAYMGEFYVIKDGRILITTVLAADEDEVDKTLEKMETLN